MIRFAVAMLSGILAIPMLPAQTGKTELLDLTRNRPILRHRPWRVIEGSGGGLTSGWHPPPPRLKIALLQTEKTSYQFGDEAVFEILIENITKEVVVIPWSAELDIVKPDDDRDPPGYASALLSLVIEAPPYGWVLLASHSIYGSNVMAGSLKRLAPGEKVRIRAPGMLYVGDAAASEQIAKRLPGKYEVHAEFSLFESEFHSKFEQFISENGLFIRLRKHEVTK